MNIWIWCCIPVWAFLAMMHISTKKNPAIYSKEEMELVPVLDVILFSVGWVLLGIGLWVHK